MTALIRRFGLGLLLGSNGRSGEYAESLLDSRYSRSAEADADAYSLAHLRAANISPRGTAEFFDRLGKQEGKSGVKVEKMFAYVAGHPPSDARRDMFLKGAGALTHPVPALDDSAWQGLRTICASSKPRRS
jgi:predicted Zn-dependent protease